MGPGQWLAGEDALSADQRAGSTEMIDLEVPDEDNVENKTTGEPEDTSSALDSFGKEDAGLMGSESAESDTVHANKALERSMGILQGVKAFGTVVGTVMGVGLVSQNYADYGDKFMGLSVLALVMVFLSVASPETLAASSTQLRESLISEEGSSASDSAAAADDRNTASNFPVGSDSTPSKTRHEDAQSRSCAHKFCGLERGMFSHIRLIARDPVLTKIAWFAVFFAFAGACLSTVSAYTVSISCGHRPRLRWPSLLVDRLGLALYELLHCAASRSSIWSHLDLRLQGCYHVLVADPRVFLCSRFFCLLCSVRNARTCLLYQKRLIQGVRAKCREPLEPAGWLVSLSGS